MRQVLCATALGLCLLLAPAVVSAQSPAAAPATPAVPARPGIVTAPPPTPAAYTPQSSFTTGIGFFEANNTPFASGADPFPN
ncbi:MAG: hypothetical protein IRZ14_14525 [Chloroflexi bacterium]|nr:hypothetical protein [Chloroflexota bacterium]